MNEDRSQVKTLRLLRLISMLAHDPSGGPSAINKRFSRLHGRVCQKTTERDLALLKADIGHFRGNGSIRMERPTQRRDFNACDRMQAKLVRILRMIDLLADDRPRSLPEINRELDRVTGATWCLRTIRRDVAVLKALDMVTETHGRFTLAKHSESGRRLSIVAGELFKGQKV